MSYKFSILASLGEKNNLYSNLMSSNFIYTINKIYIPGGEPVQDPLIETLRNAEDHFKKISDVSPGAYYCECGFFYQIGDCSRPAEISKCKCGRNIGGTNHILVNTSKRIYKDAAQKNSFNIPILL